MSRRPVISVLLPTVRPALIARCLPDLAAAADGVPHEVIVVADFPAPIDHDPWIVRERRGVIDAVNIGYHAVRGDYVFLTNDETTHAPGALRQLYEAAQATPDALFCPKHFPLFPFFYYGKFFAAFPFAHRDLLDRLGGLLDPVYRGFYADPDLSLRAYAAGVPVQQVEAAAIFHCNDTGRPDHVAAVSAYLTRDRATFRARWDHLGEFRDP